MRIIYLNSTTSVVLCFVLWFIIQLGAALICRKLPDRWLRYDSTLFRAYPIEDGGKIYEHIFKIRKWKRLLPDGAALSSSGYRKRHINDFSQENLEKFLLESCRGELTHWIPLLSFWVFGFFTPPTAIPIMLVYALISNLPCIIAQRYNRPRVKKLLDKIAITS